MRYDRGREQSSNFAPAHGCDNLGLITGGPVEHTSHFQALEDAPSRRPSDEFSPFHVGDVRNDLRHKPSLTREAKSQRLTASTSPVTAKANGNSPAGLECPEREATSESEARQAPMSAARLATWLRLASSRGN